MNMYSLGILAYGSLIEDPGKEISSLVRGRVEGVETPFRVEFARKSNSRCGAPTVVPVGEGGASVHVVILLLESTVSVEQAEDLLWRRETRNECGDKHYKPPANPGPDHVIVNRLNVFSGVGTVLYTSIQPNIKQRTPEHLAELAIESAKGEAGASGRNGVSYLISLKRHGVRTPLMPDYEAAILKKTGATTLDGALERIRRGNT